MIKLDELRKKSQAELEQTLVELAKERFNLRIKRGSGLNPKPKLLRENKITPDALFVANDHMAFAAMDVIRFEFKLRIPEDVSVVGYDDVPPACWPSYSLTTVKQRADEMVQETVRILTESIDKKDQKITRLTIDSPIVIRSSTRKRN